MAQTSVKSNAVLLEGMRHSIMLTTLASLNGAVNGYTCRYYLNKHTCVYIYNSVCVCVCALACRQVFMFDMFYFPCATGHNNL